MFVNVDGKYSFPLVMVGGVLEANRRWDIGREVVKCISRDYPGAIPIRPKVCIWPHSHLCDQATANCWHGMIIRFLFSYFLYTIQRAYRR